MKKKSLFAMVFSAVILLLVFGTFQLIGGEEVETRGIGFVEKDSGYRIYTSLRTVGGNITYGGINQRNRSFVVHGDERFGPYAVITRLWSTERGPVYTAVNSSVYENLYVAGEPVETLEGAEFVLNPSFVDGELTYIKAELNQTFANRIVNMTSFETGEDTNKSFETISRELDFYETQNRTDEVLDMTLVKGGVPYGENYEKIMSYGEVDGELVYAASDDGKSFYVVDNVKQKEYDSIGDFKEINGELAYKAVEDGKEFLVMDGEEGEKYDSVLEVKEVGGEPAYLAQDMGYSFPVVGGEEGMTFGGNYYGLRNLTDIGGEPGFIAERIREPYVVVGQQSQKPYVSISGLISSGGESAYIAYDGEKSKVVHGDQELKEFDDVGSFTSIGSEIAYTGVKANEKVSVVMGDEFIGNYSRVNGPFKIGGELGFIYSRDGYNEAVHFSGEDSMEYDTVESITERAGAPVFLAERNKNQYLVEFIKG